MLFLRLTRALALFGIIFASYMLQLAIYRAFRTWETDANGRRSARQPAWVKARRQRVDTKNAKRLYRGMLKLRGVFIKLGQVLSIMGGFLPRAYATELESLQDQVPPQPFKDIERTFIESFGKKPDELYTKIEHEPIAAASLGQVHVAYLADGTKVAVKVLYSRIREIIKVDMRVVGLAIRVLQRFLPFGNIQAVHEALTDLLRNETDYLHEAACMERMAKNFADEDDILFPTVVKELSSREILTMTFMEGIKITKFAELERRGVDRTRVARRLVESFYKQLFVHRFFHADPHPGNFLVQPGSREGDPPRLVVLDFGAISEVSDVIIDGALEVLKGIFTKDGATALRGFRHMGFVGEGGDSALLERTAMLYFQRLLKIEDRSAGALISADRSQLVKLADPELERQELQDLMRSFHYPKGWFYVERASVLAFWLCGQIDPKLDTMGVGLPYVMPLMMKKQMEDAAAAG
jgi:predicted unusual protein kinase regulating ubiquinone biosynthesis (AarF/ABC1/UbiB family)